jgi:hypothetical protein
MDLVISLGNVAPAERRKRLEAAADAVVRFLGERFPAGEGYVLAKEDRLAKWAWPPPGHQKSEQQLMKELDPDTRARAFRLGIRLTRSATWGLTIDLQTTERSMGEVKLMAMAESILAIYLAVGGFVLGTALTVGYAFATGHAEGRAIKAAMLMGFVVGAVVGAVGWLVSRPFEGVKPAQVKEILDAMAERVRLSLGG